MFPAESVISRTSLWTPALSYRRSTWAPVALLPSPDGLRWYVVEKTGRILVLDAGDPGATPTVFADLENQVDARGEGGLLGMAFDPDFPGNGRVYLSYTTSDDPQGQNGDNFRSVVSFFPVMPGGQTLDIGNETPLLTLSQRASNHNGGMLAFGPDGFLYIGLGDGGRTRDPLGHVTRFVWDGRDLLIAEIDPLGRRLRLWRRRETRVQIAVLLVVFLGIVTFAINRSGIRRRSPGVLQIFRPHRSQIPRIRQWL